MARYSLIDAYARSLEFPETFPFPGFDAIAAIRPGALVKVGVEFEGDVPTGERFWVIVERAFEEGMTRCFRGRIDNELCCTARHGLRLGDEIEFQPNHVLAIRSAG